MSEKLIVTQARERLAAANKERPLIYISGPITRGDKIHNHHQAILAHRELIKLGFSVINPMVSMTYEWNSEIPHEAWLENDLPHVAAAEAVLRLPGESLGAEMECLYAEECGVPIYTSVEDLICVFSHRPSVARATEASNSVA